MVLFVQVSYNNGTKENGALQDWYLFYKQYKCERGAMASSKAEWQAMSGTNGMVRLCQYQTRPNGVVCGFSIAMYRVA